MLSDTEITDDFRRQLDFIYRALEGRIPVPASVRLPHAEVMPTVQAGILTFVAVDQSRSDEIPLARLYFNEDVAALRSRVEGQVRVTRHEWAGHEQAVCQR